MTVGAWFKPRLWRKETTMEQRTVFSSILAAEMDSS
jgi:hypothetical protein